MAINGSITAAGAAEVCLREVCQQIGWPVGRLFITDEHSATRFVPNPIWYFSDAHRFEGFRQATEMFERDLTNKFVLEHRLRQGKRPDSRGRWGFRFWKGIDSERSWNFRRRRPRSWTERWLAPSVTLACNLAA